MRAIPTGEEHLGRTINFYPFRFNNIMGRFLFVVFVSIALVNGNGRGARRLTNRYPLCSDVDWLPV
jgi:hypothetical protein